MRLNWKSSWILGVVVLMLLAGYLLQGAEDGGDSTPEVPDSELTPAAGESVAPPDVSASDPTALTKIETLVAGFGTPSPASPDSRDLQADEARGGHTIARHIGKSDDELRARLKAEPDISAASTWSDYPVAARSIQRVLDAKRSDVEKWEKRSGSRPNLVLRMDLGEVVGRSIEQGESRAVEVQDAVVVLRWDGSGWYVLTSYPEDR
jgi:hypothetical protein